MPSNLLCIDFFIPVAIRIVILFLECEGKNKVLGTLKDRKIYNKVMPSIILLLSRFFLPNYLASGRTY